MLFIPNKFLTAKYRGDIGFALVYEYTDEIKFSVLN